MSSFRPSFSASSGMCSFKCKPALTEATLASAALVTGWCSSNDGNLRLDKKNVHKYIYIYIYIYISLILCVWYIYDIWYMIYDVWCMICDIWYMMYDMWCMVYDIWYVIYDMWYMIYVCVYLFIYVVTWSCLFVCWSTYLFNDILLQDSYNLLVR